jgi:hypothetical protein
VIDNDYVWHEGYWAPHVGFYGGIDYGFGYFGVGFAGGYWRDRDFYYNRAVTNVTNVNVTNVYNSTVVNNRFSGGRASFNGGDGVHARPLPSELTAAREPHRGFTPPQRLHAESARSVPGLLASVNHGHPSVAATERPGQFKARNVEPARATAGAPSMWHHSAPTEPVRAYNASRAYNTSRPEAPSHPIPQSRGAVAWNQPTMTHSDGAAWRMRGDVTQNRARSNSATVTPAYRPSDTRAPLVAGPPRSTPYRAAPAPIAYRQAPAQSAPTAYRQAAPSYSAPRAAPQAMPSTERHAMAPRAAPVQMPQHDPNAHGSPPSRGGAPAQAQDRRRS